MVHPLRNLVMNGPSTPCRRAWHGRPGRVEAWRAARSTGQAWPPPAASTRWVRGGPARRRVLSWN